MLLTDNHEGVPKANALREASSAMAFQKRESTYLRKVVLEVGLDDMTAFQ